MENQFIKTFKEALDIEEKEITLATVLKTLDVWDSMGYISIMSMIDEEFGVEVTAKLLKECVTVADIYALCRK